MLEVSVFASFYNFTIAFRDHFDIVCFSFYFTDFSSNRLYWIDNVYKQIQSSNLNGTDIKLLATSPHYMPWAWGLIVYETGFIGLRLQITQYIELIKKPDQNLKLSRQN